MKLSYIDDNNKTVEAECSVGNTDSWEYTVVFQEDDDFKKIFATEGLKKIEVYAIDAAGNISEIKADTFLYDTKYPEVSVSQYKMGNNAAQTVKTEFFVSESFSLFGSANDTYGIKSLTVKQVKGEGEDAVELEIPVQPDNNGQWTIVNLPRSTEEGKTDQALVETGTYKYSVTVIDKTGEKKAVSADYTVRIDLEAPVVSITSPAKDRNPKLSENYGTALSGENFGFSGKMSDNGTGVKDYSYKFVKADEDPADVTWIAGDRAGDTWNIYAKASELEEGEWSLFVKAIDNAGNESAVAERKFVVDQTIPSLEAEITENENCKKNKTVWYYKGNLSGKIKEADDSFGLDELSPFTFSIGNVDVTSAVAIDDNGNWTIDSSLFTFDASSLENSEKTLFITVHDKVGKTNSTSFTIYKDTAVPQIDITYPAENDPINDSQFTARGSITDGTGIGVENLEYMLNESGNWLSMASGITSTTWTQAFNFTAESEGKITLSVRAKDMLGNESASTKVSFYYDKQDPQLSITNADDSYYVKDSSFTLYGTAYDTNSLSYVTIQDDGIVYSSKNTNDGITLNNAETAHSAETAAEWSKTFTTGSNGNLKDGLHTLKVYAYDSSNRVSLVSTKEVFVDTTLPTVILVDVPSTQETETSYYQFSGEVKDLASTNAVSQNAASGIDKVYVKFADKNDATKTTDWCEALGTTNWTLLVNYADNKYTTVFGSEGKKTIFVKAVDKAGNESVVSTTDFIYDKAKPTATVSSYTVGSDTRLLGGTLQFDVSDSFSLTGTASDSYKLKKIQILQRKNDEDDKVVAEINANTSSYDWTVSDLPRADSSLGGITGTADTQTDATYKYAVKVFDDSSEDGKLYQTYPLSVRIDRTAPVVEITSPSADLAMNQALSGQSYVFAGSATDIGVGLEKYQYAFTKTSTAPTAWTTVTTSESGLWQIEKNLIDGSQSSALGLSEGQWYFWFKASDTAGNESTPISRSFYVDRNNPTLNSQITTGSTCISQSGIYYFKNSLSGTVTAGDTNALDRIEFKLDETLVQPTIVNGTWTIPATAFTESTLTTLVITAYDAVGKTTSNTYQVYLDTTVPTVNVASSALKEGDNVSKFPLTIYGTADDGTGIGADTIYYSIDGSQPSNALAVNGSSWTKEITGTSFEEGNLTLKLKIKDKLGNESSVTQIIFYYDVSVPSLTETGIGEAGATVHTNITLQGTADDSNELVSVIITDNLNTESNWTIARTDMTETTGGWSWSQNIALGTETNQLADGNHTLTIIAKDIAGKTTKVTRSVVVDNTPPTITVTKPASDIVKHYSKNSSYTFEGTASDNLGIKTLEAKLYKKTGGVGNDEVVNTADLSVNGGNWKWTVYELNNSSSYYATFEVKDIADNIATVTTKTIVTDFTAPVSTLKVQKNGAAVVEVSNNSISTTNDTYTLSGTVSDSNFDVQTCTATVKADNATNSTPLTFSPDTTDWTYTGIAEEGEHTYIFKFSDLAGNENSYTLKVRYDTQAPEVLTITTPAADDATGVNAISGTSKKFTGSAEDNGSGLASYSYVFAQTPTAPVAGWTTVPAENGAWEITRTVITTTNPSAECLHEGEWYLFVKATDKAGNTSTSSVVRHFWVDQSIPSISNVSIPGGTYYFKTDTLTISGKAIDTNALTANNAVVIKKIKVGSTDVNEVLATINAADVDSDGIWNATIEADAIPDDGTSVTITIEATDIVGKSSGISTYTVCKDKIAPVVTASPVTNAEMSYQRSVNYTFSGTATDANLEEVTAVLYRNGVATTETTTLSPKGTNGAWEWKVYDLEDDYYSIKVTAEDKAGNITEYTTGSVMVDTIAPKTTVNGSSLYDEDGNALSTGSATASLSTGTTIEIEKKYAQSSYTLSGVVSDSNFEYNSQSVVIKENGTEKSVTFTGEGTVESPYTGWSYTPAAFAENTEVTNNYSITVTDKAGNKTTYSIVVVYDKKAPVLTITSPVNKAYDIIPAINGKVVDGGIGVKDVKWTTTPAIDNSWKTISMSEDTTEWSDTLTSLAEEGSVTLYVKATDVFGNLASNSVSFSYDLYYPEVTETDEVEEYQKENYNFTLFGTAGDTNGLDYITITEGNVIYGSTDASDSTGTARITLSNEAVTLSNTVASDKRNLSSDSGKGKKWSITFSPSTNPLSEGNHKFTITAKDSAGKVSDSRTKNIFVDTIKPAATVSSIPTTSDTARASFKFTGTANDNAGGNTDSGIDRVFVNFSSYSSEDASLASVETGWLEANVSGSNWNYQAVFSDNTLNTVFGDNEGYKTISVKTIDIAGNESNVVKTSKFLYDRDIPTATINSYLYEAGSENNLASVNTFFANDNFKLKITVQDGYKVKTVVVKQKKDGVSKTIYSSTVNSPSQTITVDNLPRDVSEVTDDDATNTGKITLTESSSGQYEYSVEVTDYSNPAKTSTSTSKTASIDKKAPTVTIANPSTEIDLSNININNVLDTDEYSFKINAMDNTGGVGLSSISYTFSNSITNATANMAWKEQENETGSIYIEKSLKKLHDGNTQNILNDDDLPEGTWYLWAKAKDSAGNESSPVKKLILVDKKAPDLIVSEIDTTASNPVYIQDSDSNYTIGGTVSDTNELAATDAITIIINNDTANSIQIGKPATGSNWSYSIPKASLQTNADTSIKIIAKDVVGRTDTKTFSLYYDTEAPELEITAPTSNEPIESSTTKIKGTVADNGFGLEKLEFELRDSTGNVVKDGTGENAKDIKGFWADTGSGGNYPLIVKGEQWYYPDSSNANIAGAIPLGTTEGELTLYVKATEKGPERTTEKTVVFYYDTKNPYITETKVGTSRQITNSNFVLEGKSYDTNELKSIVITEDVGESKITRATTDNRTTEQVNAGVAAITFTSGSLAGSKTLASAGTWHVTFDKDNFENGEHIFSITAYDISNKSTTVTRTVLVDKQNPSFTEIKATGGVADDSDNSKEWFGSKSVRIEVKASDNEGGSGIETVEYSTIAYNSESSSSDPTEAYRNWQPLAGNTTYAGTVTFTNDGENKYYVRAKDIAGNYVYYNTGKTVYIDTTAPVLTATNYSYDNGSSVAVTDSVYVNGSKTLKVYGTYSDAGIGVQNLTFKLGNSAFTPTTVEYSEDDGTWMIEFTPTSGGKLFINGKDKLNNAAQECTPFTIVLDNTLPTISNISLNDTYKPSATTETYYTNNKNTIFKLTGVASDNTGVESVSIVIKNAAGTATTITPVLNAGENGSLNNWNFTFTDDENKNAWKALSTSATAVLKVTDKAKNETTQDVTINFDVDSPYSTHELDASTPYPKDLYFRIGNQDNEQDTDVGGKYAFGTYGNDTSVEIRGRFDDTGSGVKEIFYKVLTTEPAQNTNALEALKTSVLDAPDGSFSLKTGSEKQVSYTKDDGTKAYKSITTNFREKLTGFVEGENYLVLVAVDNVGNAAVDTVTVDGVTHPNYSINVDRTAPTLVSDTTETLYTNAGEGKTIELSGTVTDDAAGVDKVVIIHPTNTTETELPATVNGNNWSCTLDATILADISGIKSIYAKAYDKAGSGNWTKVEVARVIVDKTNPTITLDTPNDADESSGATGTQINGTIKLTGTASDKIGTDSNNKFTVTRIEYRMTKKADGTAVTNNWAPITTTLMPGFAIASSESFVVNGFDTTKLTDKATYELRAVVEDYAGNKTESAAKTVVVDQDTDRPVITLSNLELQSSGISYLKSTNNLYLSVTDDDGVSEVKYKIGDAEDWTQLTGSSINLGDTDGLHVIKFTVKDKAGNTFDSTSDPTPKITDAEGEIVRSGNLELSVVTKKPVVKDIQYSYYDKLKTLGANETDANRWSDWASSIGTLSAEKYSKLKIKLTASSAQTVKEASATYVKDTGSSTISFTCVDDGPDNQNNHKDDGEHDWISNEIVIDNTANLDKSQNIRIRVIDVVPDPLEYTETVSINVDNKKPVIEIAAPSSLIGQEETIHGEVKNENEVTMYYAVSRYCEMNANGTPNESAVYADTAVQPADTIRKTGEGENEIVLATAWEELIRENTGLKWNVYFDGKLKEGSATEFEEDHTAKLGTYLTEAYLKITTAAAIADTTSPYDSRTPLYFWIKAVDNYGNETIEKQKLNIDPQAERPIVEISYPVNEIKNGVSVAPTLGGTIRLMGTATDNNAAKYVWIQIDHDNNGFDKDDLALLNTVDETDNTKRKHGYKLGQISSNTEKSIADISAVIAANESISDYGIMVDVKGTGWNQTINSNGEFNDANGEATLKITVYATDADATPHKSLPAQQEIKIDSRIPYVEQSSLELVQYGTKNGNVTPVIARRPYTQDAKISGIWYLTGNIKDDDSGIGVIKCNETQRIASSGSAFKDTTDENYWFKPAAHTNNTSQYDYQFSIPIGNLTQGSVGRSEIKLEITENTNNPTTIYPTFSAIYDNKDPVLNTDTTNSLVNLENKVENSNGFYSFRAIASEDKVRVNGEDIEQSGIERIAFYFTRDLEYSLRELDSVTYSEHSSEDDAETHDLFDVMIYHKNKDSDDVASGNMIIDYTSDSSLTKENGLYWRKVSGASISGKTVTITAKDNNIHPKGLAKIKGTIYLIDTVSADGKDITLDEAPGNGTADVLFAICNVIDNGGEKNGKSTSTTQGYGYGYYPVRVGLDDGDLMTENFSNQGTDWIFDASINSKNLPDGPITLHFVAFDKAGNIAEWNSTGFGVANNAPRIAGMTIGVDSNGNGSVDENEFIEDYSNLYALGNDKSGNPMDEVTLPVQTSETTPTAALTIRGITEIRPELVGGNGSITYDYNVYNRNGQTWSTTKEREVEGTEIATGTTDAVAPLKNGKGIELPVSAFIGTTNGVDSNWITDGDNKKFEFIFSDSTPGTTIGTKKSNKATLNVIMNVKLREENKAKNWILPFYWKSATDNSLFKQSKDNGHIEIASDWVFADGYTSNSPAATSGEYDNDPKASGKIKIEGIAQDDTLLRDIKVKFSTAMSTTGGIGTTETTIASYDFDTGKWGTVSGTDESQTFTPFGVAEPTVISESGWVSYVKQATYQDLLDANIIQTLPVVNNVKKKATDEVQYNTQEYGHIVHWILYLDTEKITGVAATDVTVTATASDRGKPVWSGTAESGTVIYSANETVVTGKPEEGNTPFSGIVTKNESNEPVFGILTGAYRMDVVPYISGIKTSLSSLKKGNSSVYDRTARGHYPVVETEDIYLYGFNLTGAKLYDSSASPKSVTLTQIDDITSEKWYISDLKFNKAFKAIYSTTDPKSDGISKFASGGVYVKVGTIESLNNKNNQNARGSSTETTSSTTGDKSVYDNYYNRQPNGDSNNLLTDDVILDIWKINSEAGKPISGPLSQPVMAINPVNKQVGFAFASGPLHFSMGDLDNSYIKWEQGLDFWTSIGFAYDAKGNSFGTTAGGDINGDPSADSFGIFTSRWTGKALPDNKGGHNNGTGQLRLELVGQAESTNGKDFNGNNINKQRIKSPSIATTVDSTDVTSTTVYLAYYDEINDEIRFKWGILSDSNNIVRKGRIYYAGKDSYYGSSDTSSNEKGLFADYYGPKDGDGAKDSGSKTVSFTEIKKVQDLPYTMEYVSLIAGQTKDKWTFYKDTNNQIVGKDQNGTGKYKMTTAVTTKEGSPVCAGQYVSIAAKKGGGDTYLITYDTEIEVEVPDLDPDTGEPITDEDGNVQTHTETQPGQGTKQFTDDLIVAVWYDATNNQLLYSYNKAPQKITASTYAPYSNDATRVDSWSQSATGWSTPVAVFGEGNGIGEYCKVALDANGKVHIACYDNANADVWYAYIDNYASPSNAKTCIVDSYGIVGTELSLDVALKDGNPVPYISYYGSSCARPKIAYWAGDESILTAASLDGAIDEKFTESWETSIIPSLSKISIDHINVGVWKDSSGNLVYSTTDGAEPNGIAAGKTGSNLGKPSAGNNDGKIYGNGTMNPILGYAITKGAGGFIETAQKK